MWTDTFGQLLGLVALLIPLVFIGGGIIVVVLLLQHRMRLKELAHRERIAMIEKGLMPAPETDPAAFAVRSGPTLSSGTSAGPYVVRYRTPGITLIGLGFGLMIFLGVAAQEPAVGIGLGGALVVLGLTFLVNWLFQRRNRQDDPQARPPESRAAVSPPRNSGAAEP
jgi:hypothetical protein